MTTGPPPKISVPARRMFVKKSSACVGALTTDRAMTMPRKKVMNAAQLKARGCRAASQPMSRFSAESRRQDAQQQPAPDAELEVERGDKILLVVVKRARRRRWRRPRATRYR